MSVPRALRERSRGPIEELRIQSHLRAVVDSSHPGQPCIKLGAQCNTQLVLSSGEQGKESNLPFIRVI